MADNNSRRQPQTVFAGATSNNNINVNDSGGSSRLLVDSNNLRNILQSRNLYTPDVEYPLNPNSIQKVVNAISSIGSALAPFKGFDLKNSAIGRIASLAGNSTPLSEIGLVMLGKQFAMNSASHLAQQTFPTIKLANLFDGSKDTKLFTNNINFSITVKKQTSFQNFIDNLIYNYPNRDYPFTKDPTNADFIKNTGTGQLTFLYGAINQNIYKQNDTTLTQYSVIARSPIQPRSNIVSNKTYFNFNSAKEYPYLTNHPSDSAAVKSDNQMVVAYDSTSTNTQEYAPDADFINNNFGNTLAKSTEKTGDLLGFSDDQSINSWVDNNTEFSNDNQLNKVVWGRDGTTPETDDKLTQLRGVSEPEVLNNLQSQNLKTGFNIRTGLLEYTRNLINATEGKIGDITRKAFTDGDKLVGFNGSALWRAPSTALPDFAGRKGIRQHSVLDQYGKFTKAIRFNGNQVYGGNKDSVLYKSVLPRIHPTLDKDGKPDPKNLMFSIENLAVRVLSKSTYGIIDDEYGSPIPACEVGPFNGRIMWFPPYNLEIQETGVAKFEPTSIIGRNEPMYNYMNSERGATLSFTLLIDYPQQLKNFANTTGKQKEIAEFFAFGGQPFIDKFVSIENYEFKIAKLTNDIETIKGKTNPVEPNNVQPVDIDVVFPNDVPAVNDNLNTIIDDLYKKYTYEIIDGLPSSDITSWGLNGNAYFKTGIIDLGFIDGAQKYALDTNTPSQYTATGLTDQFGINVLNNALFNTFNDENNRPYYSVYIHGAASKLFTPTIETDVVAGSNYNKKLGERRAVAVQNLVKAKLTKMFGTSVANGIEVTWDLILGESTGDVEASDSNATIARIPAKETKQERHAFIEIRKNDKAQPPKKAELSPTDEQNILKLQAEIEAAKVQLQKIKDNQSCVLNERGATTANGISDAGILHGFDSVSGNYFYPVFHSQTPEDFHKRLTFLHQCQRQGAAKSWNSVDNATGVNNITAKNSVFGRQPICILRIGDFFYTKIIIENYTIDYSDTTWDMNPEGFGMQPMMAKVTLQIKIIGGQSLKGPIDALQNAVTFNYYANSSFSNAGMYKLPSKQADLQESYIKEILTAEQAKLLAEYKYKDYTGKVKSID